MRTFRVITVQGGQVHTLLFWGLVVLDIAGILLVFLLGLAAAGSDGTSTIKVALLLLVIPCSLLGAAILLHLRGTSPLWRGCAFVFVAAPILYLSGLKFHAEWQSGSHSNAAGELTFFKPGPERELVEAIERNDAAAVSTLARRANVNGRGMQEMTPLILALRELRHAPQRHEVLAALLAAGADPNLGTAHEMPLEMAAQLRRTAGIEPMRMLLDAGADPNRPTASGEPVWFTVVGSGLDTSALELMLSHGADLGMLTAKGETALTRAALVRNWKAALFLLERGADWHQGHLPSGLGFEAAVQESVRQGAAQPGDEDLAKVVAFLGAQGR